MIVTPDELEKYMDLRFSERQKVGVEFILDGLEQELEAYLRRPIGIKSFTERFVIRPEWGDSPFGSPFYDYAGNNYTMVLGDWSSLPAVTLPVKNSPIISVDSVYVGHVAGASVVPELQVVDVDYVTRPFAIDIVGGMSNWDTMHVTYTAGLGDVGIKLFRLLILRAASREAQNLHDDNRGIQDLELRGAAPLGTGFTPEELRSTDRYVRKRI
jgi:hypothetical protein